MVCLSKFLSEHYENLSECWSLLQSLFHKMRRHLHFQMVQSSPWLPLKISVFEVIAVTTSTLVVALALLPSRPPFVLFLIPSFALMLHKVTAAALYLTKQLRSQTPLRTAIRQKSAQDVHWWFGFGIERLKSFALAFPLTCSLVCVQSSLPEAV